jgi:hypothetical protein
MASRNAMGGKSEPRGSRNRLTIAGAREARRWPPWAQFTEMGCGSSNQWKSLGWGLAAKLHLTPYSRISCNTSGDICFHGKARSGSAWMY